MDLTEEVKKLTNEYTIRYIGLQLEMKKIRTDLKALKTEYEEQGLDTSYVNKAFRMLTEERKLSPKLEELIAYKNVLDSSDEIIDKITELESKD